MAEHGSTLGGGSSREHGSTEAVTAGLAAQWSGLLVEELVRQGVGLFCLAPGSRSTPLALAVLAHPRARRLVHFDERGTAFAALGYARATGRPACWVTTSGTAVANGLPAAVEAALDGVPLLLLTADRPPELRETGANQTIRQPGLFGDYVRWSFDLPAPSANVDPAFVLTTAAQAVHRATAPPGPVHLNAMFREPFALPPGAAPAPLPVHLARWRDGDAPYTRYTAGTPTLAPGGLAGLAARLGGVDRGLVVLGKTDDPAAAPAAARLAHALGWPLVPDATSQARLAAPDGAVPYADLALASAAFRDAHRPEAVLHLGGRAASKRLLQHVEASRPGAYVVVRPDAERFDPTHQVTDRLQAAVPAFCDALAEALTSGTARENHGETAWFSAWRAASDAVARALADGLDGRADVTEPGVARAVSRLLPGGHGLVVAASMPIRDLDAFAEPDGARPALVTANRGASGIDGTVATAAGVARGLGRPVTLLVGDLALLYDLNSLALLREGPPVVVVAVNNDGGGIFSFLPVAASAPPADFEAAFGTPHGLGFEDAARLFGLAYARPDTMAAFADAYREAVASNRSSVIEVRTERAANVALHRELAAGVARAVERAMGDRARGEGAA